MPVHEIKVTFLHVDQGMGTLISIYKEKGKLTNLILIDLGCTSKKKKYAELKGVNTILNELQNMSTSPPTIDLVLISHQDSDHWNLLKDLTKEIKTNEKLKLTNTKINEIRYGGKNDISELWGKMAKGGLREFADAFKIPAKPLSLSESSYERPPFKKPIAKIADDVYVYLLCTGVMSPNKIDPSLQKNCASAVVAIEFAKVNVVIPGDAIADTLEWINDFVFLNWSIYQLFNPDTKGPTEPCGALGVPHHGSVKTFASSYVTIGEETEDDMWIGKRFSKNINANNIVASSGMVADFKHPYKSVLEILGDYAVERPAHDFVWFDPTVMGFWPPSRKKVDEPQIDSPAKQKRKRAKKQNGLGGWVEKLGYTRGIYTTIVRTGTPPAPYEPTFTISAKGEITFTADIEQAEDLPFKERYPARPFE